MNGVLMQRRLNRLLDLVHVVFFLSQMLFRALISWAGEEAEEG